MGFITQFWKSSRLEPWLQFVAACLLGACLAAGSAGAAELKQLRTERSEEAVFLTAVVDFDLPPVVEDALAKGIPLFFVLETEIYRDRWYWTDKRVAAAARTIRLAFQPLTRRWRVNIIAGYGGAGARATFNQNYDTLPEAMQAIERVARWRIAEAADVEPGVTHTLNFRFRLDLSQLPRPFQIGVAGQRDWNIDLDISQRLRLEPRRAEAKDAGVDK